MKKKIFSGIIFLFLIIGLLPVTKANAAPVARTGADRLLEDGDVCRLFGKAQAICRQFLAYLESNRSKGQGAQNVSAFEWLDENIAGQLQIIQLAPPAGTVPAAEMLPMQVHVFVVKGDQPVSNQSAGRDYELFVIVLGENNQPIPGAKVEYVVEYVDRHETHAMPQPTNAEGIVSTHFHVDPLPTYQMVKVGVLVNTAEQQKNAGTAFWGGY